MVQTTASAGSLVDRDAESLGRTSGLPITRQKLFDVTQLLKYRDVRHRYGERGFAWPALIMDVPLLAFFLSLFAGLLLSKQTYLHSSSAPAARKALSSEKSAKCLRITANVARGWAIHV
jgi:hypothetical protein